MSARFKYYTLEDSVHVEFRAVHGRGQPYPSTAEAVAVLRVPEVLYSRQATTVVLDAYVSYRLRHRRAKQDVSDDLDGLFRAMPQVSRQIKEVRARYRLPGASGSHSGSDSDYDDGLASPLSAVSELSTDSDTSTASDDSIRTPEPPEARIFLHQDAGPCDPDSLLPLGDAPPPYDAAQLAHLEQRMRDLEIALEQSERSRLAAENELRVSRAKLYALPPRRSSIRSSAPLCSNVASRDWRPPAVGTSPVALRRIW
ncbi:uncharacterized protein LOC62_05G007568 [Vanrija pseudolonga]|uniref:Uncharacterized protein n=1 Tax=Vanrija pseudolonga TaxID=143232 RepID=A0AAF1BN52_9TREE|nr:hypothetical protein LOC62_05G007568 [Vanrija pseudolonga]